MDSNGFHCLVVQVMYVLCYYSYNWKQGGDGDGDGDGDCGASLQTLGGN